MSGQNQIREILTLSGVQKTFGKVCALKNGELRLKSGEIHALMGENGAGKSSLIKVLTGIYHPDAGEMTLAGEKVAPQSSTEAQKLGISTVYQEVNLIPTLSVAENIYLGREPRRFGFIQWPKIYKEAQNALARLNLNVDVRRPLEDYSIAIQQMTAIARALDQEARVLILDEATSSLDADEVKQLFKILRELKNQGMAILMVTHFLDQVYEIADRITVLRNGEFVGEYITEKLPRIDLIAKMMGRDLTALNNSELVTQRGTQVSSTPWLHAQGIAHRNTIKPMNIEIRKGEILGIAGLLGSGRTEVARILFGIDSADEGRITIDGKAVRFNSPRQAIAHGLALSPEDRKSHGIFPELSVRENIILALQGRHGWVKTLPRKQQNEIADRYIHALKIKTSDAEQPIQTLSGGNQQKAILARWLAVRPRLLILDEPTRGIDVGAKAEIQKIMIELAQKGCSIVFISSELEEIVRCCDRVVVMKDRRKVGELLGSDIHESAIMKTIAGGL